VIALDEVSKFVDDYVVYDEHGRLDETPIEIHVAADRAGAPAVAVVDDPGRLELDPELSGVPLGAREDLLFCLRCIPIP
jgi:hypothetical protein